MSFLPEYLASLYKWEVYSRIVLALLGTGEAYLVDSRKEYRGRVELCEVQEESEDEGEGQSSRTRYARGHSVSAIEFPLMDVVNIIDPQ
jgi:hypothetical protein